MNRASFRNLLLFTLLLFTAVGMLSAQRKKSDMQIVGFDPGKAVNHFYLLKNGGAIEVSARDEKDADTVSAIQRHISSQAKAFEKGVFDDSVDHDRQPDGVPTIKRLRKEITFEVVQMESGAALRMLTINDQARSAIHDFMRFQIEQHKTGDPTSVE